LNRCGMAGLTGNRCPVRYQCVPSADMRAGVRQIIGAAAAAVVLLGAGCTSDTTDGAQPANAPAGTATHHHGVNYSPPPAPPLRAGERHVTLKMPKPYTPNPPEGGTDEYRCFLVDPKFAKRTYLTGSQFLPQ